MGFGYPTLPGISVYLYPGDSGILTNSLSAEVFVLLAIFFYQFLISVCVSASNRLSVSHITLLCESFFFFGKKMQNINNIECEQDCSIHFFCSLCHKCIHLILSQASCFYSAMYIYLSHRVIKTGLIDQN